MCAYLLELLLQFGLLSSVQAQCVWLWAEGVCVTERMCLQTQPLLCPQKCQLLLHGLQLCDWSILHLVMARSSVMMALSQQDSWTGVSVPVYALLWDTPLMLLLGCECSNCVGLLLKLLLFIVPFVFHFLSREVVF